MVSILLKGVFMQSDGLHLHSFEPMRVSLKMAYDSRQQRLAQ